MSVIGERLKAKVAVEETVPGLYPAMFCGFNARTGNFLGEKLFQWPSEETGITWVAYGPNQDPQKNKRYPVPDGLQVEVGGISKQGKHSQVMESEADFSQAYSVMVNGKLRGLHYSTAASSKYAYREQLFEKEHWVHRLDFTVISVYRAQRNESALDLTKDAADAMRALPLNLDTPEARQRYQRFLDRFGTHYLKTASFGGHWVMRTDIHDSLMTKSSKSRVEAEVEAAYNAAFTKGRLLVNVDSSESKFLREKRSSVDITCKVVGGANFATYDEWAATVLAQPLPLLGIGTENPEDVAPNLVPVSELTAHLGLPAAEVADRRATMERALESYLVWEPTSLLGFPVTREVMTTRKAATAGFIIINLRDEHTQGGAEVQIKADNGLHPKTLRGGACMDQTLAVRQLAAATVPIPQAVHYRPESSLPSTYSGATMVTVDPGDIQFVPFMGQLGQWQELPVGQERAADTDGFLVGVNQLKGAGGCLFGRVRRPGADLQTLVGAAVGVLRTEIRTPKSAKVDLVSRTQSFCMPVRKGWNYLADPVDRVTGDWHAYWIPLHPSVVFDGDPEECIIGERVQAETDGLLVAYLTVAENTGFVDMSLYVEPNPDDLSRNYSKVRIRAGYPTPRASFTLPVRKGQWYLANVSCEGDVSYNLKWFGLKGVQGDH